MKGNKKDHRMITPNDLCLDDDGFLCIKPARKTFLICPVRGHSEQETQEIVNKLTKEGWSVYWPPRDTNQVDPTGYRICTDNKQAIENADVVHFIWDGKSQGCLFDLGIAFALGKRVIPVSLPEKTEGKSFQNMVMQWAGLGE